MMSDIEKLRDLIDKYWDIAWNEGYENRRHDTAACDAQKCRSDIERILSDLQAARAGGEVAMACAYCGGAEKVYAHPPAKVPEGWKLVPIKPTKEMKAVCRVAGKTQVWADMIAAAPNPPTQGGEA